MKTEPITSPADGSGNPAFTIFIPTYNRAHTLERALDSIRAQNFRDIEVVIIDDGSKDETARLVGRWKDRDLFPITYHYQPNQGKHAAHNAALEFIRGELTVVLDSDDMLAPDALGTFKSHWDKIPRPDRHRFAGIEGLCAHMDDLRIAGSRFPADVLDSDYFEMRGKYKVGGDKKNAVRSDLLRSFPFPQFPGEKHIRPSLLWKRLSMDHKFRYINEVVQLIEYQSDGLSADRFPLRVKNPMGFRFYYLEETNLHRNRYGAMDRLKNCIRYVRYSFHARIGPGRQLADIDAPILWLLSIVPGYVDFKRDRIRMDRQCNEKAV